MKVRKTEKIVSDAHYTISSPSTGSSQLIITNISTADEGYYICNATMNELNEGRGYLQVLQGILISGFIVDLIFALESTVRAKLYVACVFPRMNYFRKNIPNTFSPLHL